MKQFIIIILAGFVLYGCGENTMNEQQVYDEDKSIVNINQSALEDAPINLAFPEELSSVKDSFNVLQLPLKIKEGEIGKLPIHGELTFKQLSFLSQNYDTLKKYYQFLDDTKEMYKRKMNGMYREYVDGLDLAELKDAVARPVGMINLDTSYIFLWVIDYSSYEACPFYSGLELYASIVNLNGVNSYYLGIDESSGDPPMFAETKSSITISKQLETKSKIYLKVFEEDEMVESDLNKRQFFLFGQD